MIWESKTKRLSKRCSTCDRVPDISLDRPRKSLTRIAGMNAKTVHTAFPKAQDVTFLTVSPTDLA